MKPSPPSPKAPPTTSSTPTPTPLHPKPSAAQERQPRPRTPQHRSQPGTLDLRARPPRLAQLLRPQPQQGHAEGRGILVQKLQLRLPTPHHLDSSRSYGTGPGVADDIRTCRCGESGAVLVTVGLRRRWRGWRGVRGGVGGGLLRRTSSKNRRDGVKEK